MSRSQIDRLHGRLLELHKVLLDDTKAQYEREQGAIPNANAYLQLVINDAAFAWLRPLSTLLVDIDDPELTPNAQVARKKTETLFSAATPVFYTHYEEVLQRTPSASEAHGETMRVLEGLPTHVSA